jgi:hypothetical protein
MTFSITATKKRKGLPPMGDQPNPDEQADELPTSYDAASSPISPLSPTEMGSSTNFAAATVMMRDQRDSGTDIFLGSSNAESRKRREDDVLRFITDLRASVSIATVRGNLKPSHALNRIKVTRLEEVEVKTTPMVEDLDSTVS